MKAKELDPERDATLKAIQEEINKLGVCVEALQAMSPIGRAAALTYLNDRFGDKRGAPRAK